MGRRLHFERETTQLKRGAAVQDEAESSNSSCSSDSSSSQSTSRTPLAIPRPTNTMDKSHFQQWRELHFGGQLQHPHTGQEREHVIRLDDSQDGSPPFQDSQAPFSYHIGSSQQVPYMTDEEFHRAMEEPPQQFLSQRSRQPAHAYSCPPNVFTSYQPNLLPNPLANAERAIVRPVPAPVMQRPVPAPVMPEAPPAPPPSAPPAPVASEGAQEQSGPPSKGKKQTKKTAKKPAKKSKKVVQLSDDDGEGDDEDGSGSSRWAHPEVQQLIAFRLEMDEEFCRNAKKQGVSTWDKLHARMIVACENFSKSPEACRKKWKAVKLQYDQDKRQLQVSGEGRVITCKFFDEIDEGFNNRANVRKLCHGDARGSPNPAPLDLNVNAEGLGSGDGGSDEATGADQEFFCSLPYPDSDDLGPAWVYKETYRVVRVHFDDSPFVPHEGPTPHSLYYPPEWFNEAKSGNQKSVQ